MRIDTTVPHPARRYDYWLGGKDNFAADRASGDAVAVEVPSIRTAVVENRRFLQRVVRWLAAECGINQFLDVGTGIPTSPNVHEIAQRVDPFARIVYVDNDPIVLTHARALLVSTPQGRLEYVDADLRQPSSILDAIGLCETLDLSRPVGLLLIAVLHFLPDDTDPYACVGRLVEALPSGSFVALSHATVDLLDADVGERIVAMGAPGSPHGPFRPRTAEQVLRFAGGLQLMVPGLVSVVDWHPNDEPAAAACPADVSTYAMVGVKP